MTGQAVEVARKARQEGIPRLRKILDFYERSLDLVNQIEEEKTRAEQLKNRDLVVRNKHSKKIARTAKSIMQLFREINQAFLAKEIKEEEGVVFSEALRKALNEGISTIARPSCPTCHLQRLKALAGTTSEARRKLSQLDRLAVLYAEYEEAKSKLNQRMRELRRELEKSKNRPSTPEPECDEALVKSYEKARMLLERYNALREEYLRELRGQRAAELIRFSNENRAEGFPQAEDSQALDALRELLEKDLPGLTAAQVIEYSSFNDKKLSHFTPEPARFRSLVDKNHRWLLRVSRLEATQFLRVELGRSADLGFASSFLNGKNQGLVSVLRDLATLSRSLDLDAAKSMLEHKRVATQPAACFTADEIRALEDELVESERVWAECFS
jgi:hypothetical protein